MRRYGYVCVAAVMACCLGGAQLQAEDTPPAGGAPAGGQPDQGGPGRGRWNPEQMLQNQLNRVKETMVVSDEDWKALQPKVEEVQKLVNQARFGGRRPRGGNDDAAQPKSEVDKKTEELRTLLENKDADPKDVKAKLEELRVAREKAKLDLKKAQDELRELVTQRQEAQLVLLGLLD